MRETDHSRYLLLVEKVASLLLLAYPTLMLAVKGGMNGAFLLMLLLALAVRITRPAGMDKTVWKSEWTIYGISMVAMSAAILISQSYHHNYSAHSYDGASRYWLAIPVFLLLRRLNLKIFEMLQVAFPAAAILGFVLAKKLSEGPEIRSGIETLDLIHFGDFELILAMLSLLGINWMGRDGLALKIIKISGFIAGVAASFASGSRGGWLAIPIFVAIFIYFYTAKSLKLIISIATIGTLSALILYSLNYTFHQRVNELTSEVAALSHGNQDTSTGIRWQLYKAAVEIFSRHPVFGVGPDGFAQEMTPMMEEGKITPVAAQLGRGEVHNDILNKAVGMGLFGLAAIIAVYLVPIWLFWKATRSVSAQVKRGGVLGIIFVTGFLVSGLTVEILNLTMAIAFYSFTVAVLLAFCYNIHHKIGSSRAG
jgi:O-antigen ligase